MNSIRYFGFMVLGLLLTHLPVLAQTSAHEPPTRIVEQFIAAYNAHDVEAMLALVHPTVQWLSVDGAAVAVEADGAETLGEAMSGYFAALPSSRSTAEAIMEAGHFVSVWERAQWESNGETRTQRSLAVYEVEEGKIRRVWYYPAQR